MYAVTTSRDRDDCWYAQAKNSIIDRKFFELEFQYTKLHLLKCIHQVPTIS